MAASISCTAQSTAPAKGDQVVTLPGDPAAFLLSAGKINGLAGEDVQPWHLKATFKTFDDLGNPKDQGIFEEFWIGPKQSKVTYSSNEFSQTYFHTSEGSLRTSNKPLPSPSMRYVEALIRPLPTSAKEIASLDTAAELSKVNNADAICITMKSRQPSPVAHTQIDATYCFDAGTSAFQSALFPLTQTEVRGSHPVSFRSRSLSGDLEVTRAGKLAFLAHLESIEPITTVDDSIFEPPPDAIIDSFELGSPNLKPNNLGRVTVPSNIGRALVFRSVAPVYPPIAEVQRVQGLVDLQITISKEGLVEDIRVISGPSIFRQAALDAVRHFIFRPALLNGVPVEVETTVGINFRLVHPNE
jgi:TonB family protein